MDGPAMEFCSICTASFDSGKQRICCSGQQCGRPFHQRCVHLSEFHVRAWLDEVGLLWFCPSCRTDFVPAKEGRKQKLTDEEGEPSAAKRFRTDPSPPLPPEVWTMIFEYLDRRAMARVRLVCRDWKELVAARSKLMNNFLLKLNRNQLIDDRDKLRSFLALGRGFTRAEIDFSNIGKEKPSVNWFDLLGQTLNSLHCKQIPFGFMYQLLREFPNLKRLSITDGFEYGKSLKPNYQMAKVEELSISEFKNKRFGETIFPTLQNVFPKLSVLKLCSGQFDAFSKDIVSFVCANRETLEELELFATSQLIDALTKIGDLRLKRITINCSEQDLLRLLRWQPTLEQLNVMNKMTNCLVLNEIPVILPNLKRLYLDDLKTTVQSTVLNLSRVEFLRINFTTKRTQPIDCIFDLSYYRSSDLRQLELSHVHLPRNAPDSFAQISTNIEFLSLRGCSVKHSSDILSLLQRSKKLTTLDLYWLRAKAEPDNFDVSSGQSSIRHLKIWDIPKQLILALIDLCPGLESVDGTSEIDGEVIRNMGHLKQLRKLVLYGCYGLTSECLRPIPEMFAALRELRIESCYSSHEEFQKTLKGLREDVYVSIEYW